MITALTNLITTSSFLKSLNITLISSLGGAAISLVIGLFFARWFANHSWPLKRLQRLVLLIPYLVPNFILASAYVVAWNPTTGLLNSGLRFPFGLYGVWGMTALFGVVHMPVAFLLLEEKFRRIDSSLLEAGQLSGANQASLLLKIELPLVRPTIISAFVLCFALNISAFAIPGWIGAHERAYPLTYKIYQATQLGGQDGLTLAAALSFVLFLLAIPPLILGAIAKHNENRFATVGGKGAKQYQAGNISTLSLIFFQATFWISQILFWIAPLGSLFVSTLVRPGCLQQYGLSCLNQVSLGSYNYVLFELSETRLAIYGSLVYGSLSALIILALSCLTLITLSRHKRLLRLAEFIFAIPLATPGAVLAIALIITLSGRFHLNLYNTPWIVVAAYVLKHMNLAFQPLQTGLGSISTSLMEAARTSGAGRVAVWRRVLFPILRPELIGGCFLVLIPILGELTMSVFLTSPSFRSIGTVLFDLQDYSDQASAGALAILLVCLILVINETARLLSRGRLGY